MIGSVNDSSPPVLVETEAAALFITGVVARGSAMGMVVTSLSPVDGGKSGVKRAVGTMLWQLGTGPSLSVPRHPSTTASDDVLSYALDHSLGARKQRSD